MNIFKKKPENKRQLRRVWGFLCSPEPKYAIKHLARKLRVPDYCLIEHCLQLGATQIVKMMESKRFREELEDHLIREHLLQPEILPNAYDERMERKARQEQLFHMETEDRVRQLVDLVEKKKISLKLMVGLIQQWLYQQDTS